MKGLYPRNTILELKEKHSSITPRYHSLLRKWTSQRFSNDVAAEFAHHGFLRRLGTLRHCTDNVFRSISPSARAKPSDKRLSDATINAQAFFANLYGAIDNLAWVWVYERELVDVIPRTRIGLRANHTELRATFSPAFQEYLASLNQWLGYVVEYRDALAHRIPLYIPPGTVAPKHHDTFKELEQQKVHALYVREDLAAYESASERQAKLMVFKPVITHSLRETSGYYRLHAQMVIDFLTIEELSLRLLEELDGSST